MAALAALVFGANAVSADEATAPVVPGGGRAGLRLDFARDWRIVAPSNDRVARTAAVATAAAAVLSPSGRTAGSVVAAADHCRRAAAAAKNASLLA